MIRDPIQGKSFKKNYGDLVGCSLQNFKLWFNFGTQVKSDFLTQPFYNSNKKNKKELLQVLQNRLKVLS